MEFVPQWTNRLSGAEISWPREEMPCYHPSVDLLARREVDGR